MYNGLFLEASHVELNVPDIFNLKNWMFNLIAKFDIFKPKIYTFPSSA